MTLDVLLVALAALVLSNVVLLVAALRTGLLGRSDGAARLHVGDRPIDSTPVASVPNRTVGPAGARERATRPESAATSGGSEFAAAAPVASEPAAMRPAAPEPTATSGPVVAPEPAPVDGPPDPTPETGVPATQAKRSRRSANGGAGSSAGRGRRFTLPSIEVDHERTERVVLSLLTGDDEAPTGEMVDAWERLVGADADAAGRRSAAVVALTLDGLEELADGGGRDMAERLVGAVLDAIRRSARASDRVASVGRGHFRVLLVDADDAVAARFVGRVRAAVDRRLALAGSRVALSAGWSVAANADGLEVAVRAAEDHRRADTAARRQTGRTTPA